MSSLLDAKSGVRGSQLPRLWHAPDYVSTAGDEAIDCAAAAGLFLDEWQQFVLRHALGERADGNWAAREVGVCVPRQNGKGGIIEALELYWLFVLGERYVVHSAHLHDTAEEAMNRLVSLIEDTPEFMSRVKAIKTANGKEGIFLKSGARVRFKTRTKSGGRGLTAPKLVLDEAMYLAEEVMGSVMPSMSAIPNAQQWYLGSAVDQVVHADGVAFARVRERGLAGDADLAWFEWSHDAENPDDVPTWVLADPSSWEGPNPAFGSRITERAVRSELSQLASRTFIVERMGVGDWPRTDGLAESAIDLTKFSALADVDSVANDPVWFAYDVSPDRKRASISVAGRRPDGRFHVEVVDAQRGTGWVADRALELKNNHKPAGFLCDGVGPAMSLLPDFERLGVEVEILNTTDQAVACGFLFDQVEQGTLRHLGTEELLSAVKGAARRPLADRWAWSRKNSSVDITPLVSCTLALWGAGREVPKGPPMVAFA